MKTLRTLLLFIILSCFSVQSEAQIFKRLGEKIERSVEKRLEKRMDETVDNTLDNVEEGTENTINGAINSKDGTVETQKTTSIPKDYTLEMTGSGPDIYMEYQVDMEGAALEGNQIEMFMKLYTSPTLGGGRAETIMKLPMLGEMRMVSLTDFDNPAVVTILNERKQEYSVLDLGKVSEAESDEKYSVTKLGRENLRGINCVHARAVNQDGEAFEIWTTTDLPGYEDISALYRNMQKMGSSGLWEALQEADAAGFMVKLKVIVEGGASVMEMVRIENTSVSQAMLQVPDGYKKKEGGWVNSYLKGM